MSTTGTAMRRRIPHATGAASALPAVPHVASQQRQWQCHRHLLRPTRASRSAFHATASLRQPAHTPAARAAAATTASPSGTIHKGGTTVVSTAPPGNDGLPYVLWPGAVEALRCLLSGRRVALLWDLDNVPFFSPQRSAPLQVRRMQALVEAAGGEMVLCRAYANPYTITHTPALLLLERSGLMAAERVEQRRDAADLALISDAVAFVKTHGSAASAVLCVSQDTDFAAPMRYLTERGVATISVSQHEPATMRHKIAALRSPDARFTQNPLSAACRAALVWNRDSARVSAAEARWVRSFRTNGASTVRTARATTTAAVVQPAAAAAAAATAEATAEATAQATVDSVVPTEVTEVTAAEAAEAAEAAGAKQGTPASGDLAAATALSWAALSQLRSSLKGLERYAQKGKPCPGSVPCVWLNPRYIPL